MTFPSLFPSGKGNPFAISKSTDKVTLLNKTLGQGNVYLQQNEKDKMLERQKKIRK